MHDSDSDEVRNSHEYDSECDQKDTVRDKIGIDHECQPTDEGHDHFLFFAIYEETESD